MSTSINWAPTTTALHQLHRDLNGRYSTWPTPEVHAPPITDEQRRRARIQWANRVRATYASTARVASIHQQFLALGAPLDIISGASYISRELTRFLTVTTHLLRPLEPEMALTVDHRALLNSGQPTSWEKVFEQAVELFCFNLVLSQPIYEALSAVSSDTAIAELSAAIAESLGELHEYGKLALQWISTTLSARVTASTQARLPSLLAAYELLCDGSPDVLDELAGEEIVVETRPGNLGTLQSNHRAAIFYDTLNSSIFALLDDFGWQSSQAWQAHYRHTGLATSSPVAIMAVGLHP